MFTSTSPSQQRQLARAARAEVDDPIDLFADQQRTPATLWRARPSALSGSMSPGCWLAAVGRPPPSVLLRLEATFSVPARNAISIVVLACSTQRLVSAGQLCENAVMRDGRYKTSYSDIAGSSVATRIVSGL